MRTREMSYADHGIETAEIKYIHRFCENANDEEDAIIRIALLDIKSDMFQPVYDSLRYGKSYETLDKEKYLHIGKDDFYGYRRQGMAAIKRWMTIYNIWEM